MLKIWTVLPSKTWTTLFIHFRETQPRLEVRAVVQAVPGLAVSFNLCIWHVQQHTNDCVHSPEPAVADWKC